MATLHLLQARTAISSTMVMLWKKELTLRAGLTVMAILLGEGRVTRC